MPARDPLPTMTAAEGEAAHLADFIAAREGELATLRSTLAIMSITDAARPRVRAKINDADGQLIDARDALAKLKPALDAEAAERRHVKAARNHAAIMEAAATLGPIARQLDDYIGRVIRDALKYVAVGNTLIDAARANPEPYAIGRAVPTHAVIGEIIVGRLVAAEILGAEYLPPRFADDVAALQDLRAIGMAPPGVSAGLTPAVAASRASVLREVHGPFIELLQDAEPARVRADRERIARDAATRAAREAEEASRPARRGPAPEPFTHFAAGSVAFAAPNPFAPQLGAFE